jgi:HlyD family secretion protein
MKRKAWGVAMLAGGILFAGCSASESDAIEASGTIEATEADLGFQIGGRVDSILVREGDRVESGQRLALLDRRELLARREAAAAQVDAQRARLSELERGFRTEEVEQARAALRAAEQRVVDAERDRIRTRNLFEGGAVSRQAMDNQESIYTVAVADRDRLRQQATLLERGARPEQISAQRAAVAQAEAALAQVEANLSQAEVHAPFSGNVTRRQREPGEVISAGLPVLTIADPGDRWVRIYVREEEVGRVHLGQTAEVRVDAFPDRVYQGQVTFIADEAEFTPRNVQTREERVKLVYRLKVRVVGDTAQDLKPGVPADVRLSQT